MRKGSKKAKSAVVVNDKKQVLQNKRLLSKVAKLLKQVEELRKYL